MSKTEQNGDSPRIFRVDTSVCLSAQFVFYLASQAGNPVKIGNGCATVTGYETSTATRFLKSMKNRGRRGSRSEARSQDTCRDALNTVCSFQWVKKQAEKTCSHKIRLRLRRFVRRSECSIPFVLPKAILKASAK